MLRPLPRSTLFPYTTLFRSAHREELGKAHLPGARQTACDRLLRARTTDGEQAAGGGQHGQEQESRGQERGHRAAIDRKSTRLNSSHLGISYAVFCLKKKKEN